MVVSQLMLKCTLIIKNHTDRDETIGTRNVSMVVTQVKAHILIFKICRIGARVCGLLWGFISIDLCYYMTVGLHG